MNARQRFQAILAYRKVDALPVMLVEPFESCTLDGWREQGMPADGDPLDYFGLDRENKLDISFTPIPAFEEKIIAEDEGYFTQIGFMGNAVRRSKAAPEMYYGHVSYPVKSRQDWLSYRERFRAGPQRYGRLLDEMAELAKGSKDPVSLFLFPYFMRLGYYTMGLERFLTGFYDDPNLIHTMFSDWTDFVLDVIKPVLRNIRPDVVSLTEDLAFKNGPHISPQIYREFWLPYQNRIIAELRKAGVENICMYTSGDCRLLLPIMMENGINLTWPLDQNSNMDPIELRRTYGKELRLIGGISKQTLTEGKAAIDRRIGQLMPLIQEGGFIPAPDDMIPPEVPLDHFAHFVNALRAIRL